MNPSLTTLEPPTPSASTRKILSKEGFNCSLITLSPGDDTARVEAAQLDEHILFVVDGQVTVRAGDVNTILNQDDALLIPKGRAHTIVAQPAGRAKVLRVEVPPRQIVTPQILSFDS